MLAANTCEVNHDTQSGSSYSMLERLLYEDTTSVSAVTSTATTATATADTIVAAYTTATVTATTYFYRY
jgi:hypothetical protein